MKIQEKIYGKCVTLEIKNCGQSLGNKTRRPKSYFDESKTFITNRYENLQDVKMYFTQPIFTDLFVKGYLKVRVKDNETILVKYFNDIFEYKFTTGEMYINDDGRFFAESTRSFMWNYVLRDDADVIKTSFAAKQKLTKILNEL